MWNIVACDNDWSDTIGNWKWPVIRMRAAHVMLGYEPLHFLEWRKFSFNGWNKGELYFYSKNGVGTEVFPFVLIVDWEYWLV